jgi:holliday junction DNA helicase RuvA
MIGSLTGTIQQVGTDTVLLSVGGVGYRVFVLPTLLSRAKVGQELSVSTHLNVREDDLSLYGFATMRELAFFQMLLQAPGVGPKTALSVMAIASVETLIRAIAGGDATLLTKVAGIGKKTAERIVVELKTRLEREHPELSGTSTTAHADVVDALMGLGYTAQQAREAARRLPPDLASAEEGIRAALKALGSQVEK